MFMHTVAQAPQPRDLARSPKKQMLRGRSPGDEGAGLGVRVTLPTVDGAGNRTSEVTGSVELAQLPLPSEEYPRTNHSGVNFLPSKSQFNKHFRSSSGRYGIMPPG